jgi:uncharacterized protein (DUF2336 family)
MLANLQVPRGNSRFQTGTAPRSIATQTIISELDEAVQGFSNEKRFGTLRRITDLFLNTGDGLQESQIELFDDVLVHVMKNIETQALAELSGRLAPIANAPRNVIRQLASSDEIAVAGPVLTQSRRLTSGDLIQIVNSKSQDHLLAVSSRDHIEETVTSALVERGDRQVLCKLSGNPGAQFSSEGLSSLLSKADNDEDILATLGLRADFPLKLLRDLLARASETVRDRLLLSANPELQNTIHDMLWQLTDHLGEIIVQKRSSAESAVQEWSRRDELNESSIANAAARGERDEVIAALALMNSESFDMIEQIFESAKPEAVLIPCMAAALKWSTVRAVHQMRAAPRIMSEDELAELGRAYGRLSTETAKRMLRFWVSRSKVAV